MAAPAYWNHVWVGSETGALKGVNLRKGRAENFTAGAGLRRGEAARALCWGDPRETELLVAGLDRCIRLFSTEKGKFTEERPCPGGEGPFCGLATLGSSMVTCVESGLIKVWGEDGTEQVSLEAGPGLCRMRQDPAAPHRVGTGGRENGLKVWDLQRPREPLFRAKNVRNDWLDLRVPIWDRDLQFLPGSGRVLTCTAQGQVRLYDPGSPQRRPVLEATIGEAPLTALALAPGETSAVVGSARGDVAVIDLRKGRVLRCLKGAAGGVRGLQCHPRGPLVASCGLDRFLRLHHLGEGRLCHKVYLKSQLTCLLLSTQHDWESEEEPSPAAEVKEEEEEDALWDSMETVPTPQNGARNGRFRRGEKGGRGHKLGEKTRILVSFGFVFGGMKGLEPAPQPFMLRSFCSPLRVFPAAPARLRLLSLLSPAPRLPPPITATRVSPAPSGIPVRTRHSPPRLGSPSQSALSVPTRHSPPRLSQPIKTRWPHSHSPPRLSQPISSPLRCSGISGSARLFPPVPFRTTLHSPVLFPAIPPPPN